jgi:hypothetical protein
VGTGEGLRPARGRRGQPALMHASPFLTFAVAVHRSAERLETTNYVEESTFGRQRVPVFDVEPLRQLLADPVRRYFLVELLASYTHVASGAVWERTTKGWRRRRFSELDPVRLADLLDTAQPSDRPGIYRRLGDLALFLTGVFPDSRSVLDMSPLVADRLFRMSGPFRPRTTEDLPSGPQLLESLGARWYRLAADSARQAGVPTTIALAVVEEMSQQFLQARRALNVVTNWYLFPLRERWFGMSS